MRLPASLRRSTIALLAPEWRAILVRASCKIRKTAVARSWSKGTSSTGRWISQAIPERSWNSRVCHSTAATNPSLSNTTGRSSVTMVWTRARVRSISADMEATLSRSKSRCLSARSGSRAKSILRAVRLPLISSWISRAKRLRSASWVACRRAANARRFCRDVRKASSVCFCAVTSRKTTTNPTIALFNAIGEEL